MPSVFSLGGTLPTTKEAASAALAPGRSCRAPSRQVVTAEMCRATAATLHWNICSILGALGPSGGRNRWGVRGKERLHLPERGQQGLCA